MNCNHWCAQNIKSNILVLTSIPCSKYIIPVQTITNNFILFMLTFLILLHEISNQNEKHPVLAFLVWDLVLLLHKATFDVSRTTTSSLKYFSHKLPSARFCGPTNQDGWNLWFHPNFHLLVFAGLLIRRCEIKISHYVDTSQPYIYLNKTIVLFYILWLYLRFYLPKCFTWNILLLDI